MNRKRQRTIKISDIVGAAEIAERLGVRSTTIYAWSYRYSAFPAPVATLSLGKLWSWPEVKAWDDKRKAG